MSSRDTGNGSTGPGPLLRHLSWRLKDKYNTSLRYLDLADALRARIVSGTRGALASEAELGREYGTSRVTVRRALDLLRQEGLVTSRRGAAGSRPSTRSASRSGGSPTVEAAVEAAGARVRAAGSSSSGSWPRRRPSPKPLRPRPRTRRCCGSTAPEPRRRRAVRARDRLGARRRRRRRLAAPTSSGRTFYDLLPLAGRRARLACTRRSPPRSRARRPRDLLGVRAGAPSCCSAGASPTTPPAYAAHRLRAPLSRRPHRRSRSSSSLESRSPAAWLSQIGPHDPGRSSKPRTRRYPERVAIIRERLGRPLTFAEKILLAHADDPARSGSTRGVDYGDYRPDRVAMQDATAQMALLQFMLAKLPTVAVPDHGALRPPDPGARRRRRSTCRSALDTNREVYEFLRIGSAKYGIGFWKPGSGIIHQVVLENYAFPGGMMIGTDSHTPNAGGLGMIAIGVGGADAVDVMAGWPYNTRVPKLIGVRLTGTLSGWTAAEGHHPEGRGHPHRQGRHRRDRRVLRPRRGVDLGHRQGDDLQHGRRDRRDVLAVPLRPATRAKYLKATGREEIADLADRVRRATSQRPRGRRRSRAVLRPRHRDRPLRARAAPRRSAHARPRPPDLGDARPRPKARATRRRSRLALVGSCTNSSYEDIGRAAHVARQASARGLRVKTPLMITPGSEQVRATIERDGLLADLEAIGATVLANVCGPCIGQWQRDDIAEGRDEHDRHVVQPQLPGPQRRQRGDALVHRLARDRRRAWRSAAGSTSTSCASPSSARTAARCGSRPRSPTTCPSRGLRPGRVGVRRRPSSDPDSVDDRS